MRNLLLVLLAVVLAGFPSVPASAHDEKPLSRIAFGSCAHQERPQPIWEAVVAARPELFLFAGDNIYADTEDMAVMRAKYAKLAAMPGYQKLLKTCPVLATWDDHDYGVDDGGAEYPKRAESQKEFLDFFGVSKDDPRRKREGIYHAEMFGPPEQRVQVILLDTRYFRSPLKQRPDRRRGVGPYLPDPAPEKTMLGEAQWQWLEQELRKPAKVRLIVSSIQVVPEDHGWEKWMNLPHERDRLYALIRDTKAEGVIFLSGDRHLAELSQMDGGVGYPLYDLTSSGLNQAAKRWRPQEANRHRVATMNYGDNFGLLVIDWQRKDPLIRLQICDDEGDIMIQAKVPLSVLQRGTLPLPSPRAKLSTGEELTDEVIEKNLGKKCTVLMHVLAIGKSDKAKLIFLNSATTHLAKENFTIVLGEEVQKALAKIGVANPAQHFLNKQIQITGVVTEFRGAPQIIVSEVGQIRIVEE